MANLTLFSRRCCHGSGSSGHEAVAPIAGRSPAATKSDSAKTAEIFARSEPRNCRNRRRFCRPFERTGGDLQMWKPPASIIGCCLAALPLIGCAERFAALPTYPPPTPAAAYVATPAAGIYTTPATPSAILVFVPAMPAMGNDDLLIRDPSLWAAQGFDVVMPDIAQLIADRRAALSRLVASARRAGGRPDLAGRPGSCCRSHNARTAARASLGCRGYFGDDGRRKLQPDRLLLEPRCRR